MDNRPLPLSIAESLVRRFNESAIDVARHRAADAEKSGDLKDHDHALMVLTEVEDLLMAV